jgi:hypothetical protein
VNLLWDNIHTVKKNTETLIDASKEFCIEVQRKLSICCCLITRIPLTNQNLEV